ncbi:unnamed protein product [Brassicogethes aeneus]|uniref:Uncharacterized protein n=1 Tax=Brassicogethes aeneus TaxID=1431903 RepID=A0A9P0F9R2_BRAAE|nr:unnamed protein product [Brassicogethes aeneus]
MVSLLTDVDPAMVCKEKDVVKRIRDKYPDVMDSLVKLINFMRSYSALQHRQLNCFCDSAYSDLLQHNNVRWLSKGQVIERIWLVKEQVTSFLQNLDTQGARKHLEFITNERNMLAVAFLKNILNYLKKTEEDIAVCLRLRNEFATRFQDFAKLS